MQLYESSQLIFLWLIPLVAGLSLWGSAQWRRRVSALGAAKFIENRLLLGFSWTRRRFAGALVLGVFLFSTLALARPQWGEEKKRIERKGVDLVFLLDTSLSMLAEDVKPNRLEKSKLEIKNLIRRLKGDRVGMVAFSGSSFLQCPLTLDYSAFLLFIDALKPGYLPNPGTSLAQALELGIRAFPEESRKYRAILVFSDGEDHEGGVEKALEKAIKAGVRIYTVGMGTMEGEPIPLRSVSTEAVAGYKKDRAGQVVITRLNPALLTEMAQKTGGLYFPATAAEKEIDVILKHLETLGERQLKERLIREKEDHFQLFLVLAFLLLVGETLWGNRRVARPNLALPLLAFFLFSGLIETPRSLVEKGNRNVQEKKYQSAVENYRKAQVARPKEPVIRYNLGTALYQLYEYREAEKELEQALSQAKDNATRAKALYNYGNTQYRLGNFEKAIDAYKKVLDLNPKEADAKYNLEFLLKKKALFEKKEEERKKEQKQKPPPQPQPQQKQEQPQPKPQPQQKGEEEKEEPQPQTGEQKEERGTGEKPERKEGEEQQKKQQSELEKKQEEEKKAQEKGEKPEEKRGEEPERKDLPAPQPLQGQMNLESALRLLDALQEGEAKLQDLRRPPLQPEPSEVLKDW